MSAYAVGWIARLARLVSLVVLAALGTTALMRYAPGYFTDGREMDAQYSAGARAELQLEREQQGTYAQLTKTLLGGWLHGDLGRSRHFDEPVLLLMAPRLRVTGRLLFSGVAVGWLLAAALALPLSARRTNLGEAVIAAPTALLLSVPAGALATACLLADHGGPVLVLSTLVGVRDFKLIYRLLRQSWQAPHLLYARSLGMPTARLMRVHLLPRAAAELAALATMSFVLALSAIVPVEVIFDVPGLGQLAWSAAMNRDMPVLLAVTMLMALAVGLATLPGEPRQQQGEAAQCA